MLKGVKGVKHLQVRRQTGWGRVSADTGDMVGVQCSESTSPDFPRYLYYNFLGGGSIFPERYPSLPMIYLGNLVNSIDTEFGQCNSVLGFQLFWPQRSVDKRAQY